jgi:signal transduction histidine kinase
LCKAIKKDPALNHIPVILMTSLKGVEEIGHGLESGADNFIYKPYNENSLISHINSLLSNQALHQKRKPKQMGVQLMLGGKEYKISSSQDQIMDLLVSSVEGAVYLNQQLMRRKVELDSEIQGRIRIENALREQDKQLSYANRELEAFSYSVSHDLRAPLRAMNGFSQILYEDLYETLSEQNRDYLQRIRTAASQMDNLINSILSLSRISRTEVRESKVNLSHLSNDILQAMQEQEPTRKMKTKIAPDLMVTGDEQLLQILLTNLLGNAWKYTMHTKKPVIEVGSLKNEKGHTVYYVRDNGAGFDMAYKDSLFGVFQRLHNADEFPGIGIGLALVARIIHRHHGQVWGEGKVGAGATFYFQVSG